MKLTIFSNTSWLLSLFMSSWFFNWKKYSIYQVILFPPGSAHYAQENTRKLLLPIYYAQECLTSCRENSYSLQCQPRKVLSVKYEHFQISRICFRGQFLDSTDGKKSLHKTNTNFTQTHTKRIISYLTQVSIEPR